VRFVSASGAPVTLRGVDISYHSAYLSEVSALGANFARIRVLWRDVEPQPGVFDHSQLAQLDAVVHTLNAEHVAIELDLRGAPTPAWYGSPIGFWKTHIKKSHAAYEPFVHEIVQRYKSLPYVIGFGIYNEPHPFTPSPRGTHGLDQTLLHWQAAIRDQILALAPHRLVFFNVRGGNYGIKYADFKAAGFGLSHTVLGWHSFYNGAAGSGFDQQNDNWLPSWAATHNQRDTSYHGTQVNQWLNLAIPWKRTHQLGIAMLVTEWGVQRTDSGRATYDSQMAAVFDKLGLSTARWALDNGRMGLITSGKLNDQGRWLQSWMR
jgi:aryl-phospho-beta-D-glucosidase BglC (GH1 family)